MNAMRKSKSKSNEFCRVCAVLADNTKPLFEGNSIKLLPKIKDLTGLQLNKTKDLPQNICKTCEKQVQQSHKFRQRCIRAQASFGAAHSYKSEAAEEGELHSDTATAKNTRRKCKARDRSPRLKQEQVSAVPIEEVLCNETAVFKVEVQEEQQEEQTVDTASNINVDEQLLVPLKQEPKNATDDEENDYIADNDDKNSNDCFYFLLAENDDQPTGSDDNNDTAMQTVEADSYANPLSHKRTHATPKSPRRKRAPPPPPLKPASNSKPKSGEKRERIEHNFICDQCGKHFNNKQHLLTHLQRHTGISPYPCKLCPKGYYAPGDLRRHMYKHTGEKPYHCKFCECSFNDNSHLLQHTRREHTKERPFVCDQCPKTFYSSCNYKAHLTTHSGVRAFSCKLCNVSYKHRSHLKRHQNSVTHRQFLEKQISPLPK